LEFGAAIIAKGCKPHVNVRRNQASDDVDGLEDHEQWAVFRDHQELDAFHCFRL